ncbi:hypothetical protein [Streptomyces sp. N35]|uniref:hypothetical protein n=1 Tax=Streptomyces sp. N35 TaxID=2795730 RepID=UPI0018F46C89|nr:hypothetical protein [Streptomyces sp. N35]
MNAQHDPSTDADGDAPDRPLNLAVLRHLVHTHWKDLPGDTLVVLSCDAEGNSYSPFATYAHGRYAAIGADDLVGELFPLPEHLEQEPELRDLYPDGVPGTAVPALALYPLG